MRTDRRGVIWGGIGAAMAMAFGNGTGDEASARGDIGFPPPVNPATLAGCLRYLDWDPAERGPLLIIAPDLAKLKGAAYGNHIDFQSGTITPVGGADAVRVGKNGFRLDAVCPRYRRKLVTVGSLSTVIPDTMAVLRYKNLPEPDLVQGVRPEVGPQLLLGTLTPAQWRRLMSTDGIGIGDLKREQRAIFADLFPQNMKVYRSVPANPDTEHRKEEIPLSGVNLSDFRLHLYQDLSWTYSFQGTNGSFLGLGNGDWEGAGEPAYSVDFPRNETGDNASGSGDYDPDGGLPSAFGVTLMETHPNRRKPSDMEYGAPMWNAAVAVYGVKTVGELVARIREASGVEVYADRRYAELPVYVRTVSQKTVRSGDLLEALALSVTGTYRRVASGSHAAYVMTDDRVGSGVRFAAIGSWVQDARKQLEEARKRFAASTKSADVFVNAPWVSGNDMAPSAALLKKFTERTKPRIADEDPQDRAVRVSDLPSGAQRRIQSQLKWWREKVAEGDDTSYKPLRENDVDISAKLRIVLTIPGVGTVPFLNYDLQPDAPSAEPDIFDELLWLRSGTTPPDMTASLPLRIEAEWFGRRVLAVRMESVGDARKAARLAKAHRFNGLLLPVGDRSPEVVAQWLAAAREVAPGMAMWLKVSLFRREGATGLDMGLAGEKDRLDRNVSGETYAESLRRPVVSPYGLYGEFPPLQMGDSVTGDYFALGEKDALQAVQSRIVSLAKQSPGITGIVFTNTSPPGYAGQNMGQGFSPDRELGYTPAMRLAFLRENGVDPVDLSPFGDLGQVNGSGGTPRAETRVRLPFFPDGGPSERQWANNNQFAPGSGTKGLHSRWYDFRAKKLSNALETLRVSVRAETPALELFLQSPGAWEGLPKWEPPATVADIAAKPHSAPLLTTVWLRAHYQEATPPGIVPMKRGDRFARQIAKSVEWMRSPPTTPQTKAARAALKWDLLLDVTQSPLAGAEKLLSQIRIEP
ncbi:MAG: hypothetical protein H7145_20270 [Akkermansiaceae bacterium]|nr:hypothetical protein [Armatimonadota bacterium]